MLAHFMSGTDSAQEIADLTDGISERIAKLDRILPAVRLWRGFGALTVGGLIGAAFAFCPLTGLIVAGFGTLIGVT